MNTKKNMQNRLDDNTGAIGNRNCIMYSILFGTRTIECSTESDSFFR